MLTILHAIACYSQGCHTFQPQDQTTADHTFYLLRVRAPCLLVLAASQDQPVRTSLAKGHCHTTLRHGCLLGIISRRSKPMLVRTQSLRDNICTELDPTPFRIPYIPRSLFVGLAGGDRCWSQCRFSELCGRSCRNGTLRLAGAERRDEKIPSGCLTFR